MLHKTMFMHGFHIVATDGEVGHVDDFLVDESWIVKFLVVDTSNRPGGKWVLIPREAIRRVDSPHKKIYLSLTQKQVTDSPSIDTADIQLIETLPPAII